MAAHPLAAFIPAAPARADRYDAMIRTGTEGLPTVRDNILDRYAGCSGAEAMEFLLTPLTALVNPALRECESVCGCAQWPLLLMTAAVARRLTRLHAEISRPAAECQFQVDLLSVERAFRTSQRCFEWHERLQSVDHLYEEVDSDPVGPCCTHQEFVELLDEVEWDEYEVRLFARKCGRRFAGQSPKVMAPIPLSTLAARRAELEARMGEAAPPRRELEAGVRAAQRWDHLYPESSASEPESGEESSEAESESSAEEESVGSESSGEEPAGEAAVEPPEPEEAPAVEVAAPEWRRRPAVLVDLTAPEVAFVDLTEAREE